MCNVYVGTSKESYESTSRSVRIHGAVSSIRLENKFWAILDEMARSEGKTTPSFINTLYDELMASHDEVVNFSSFLRVACSIYLVNSVESEPLFLAQAG